MNPEQLKNKKYSDTVILPKTSFPMRAGLSAREPLTLTEWKKQDIYARILEKNKGGELFVLHDGPPFTNGHIHVGHALCYSLKDMVLKSRNMLGFSTPFIPGSDCHGLPIEHKIMKGFLEKGDDNVSPLKLRYKCADYAGKYIKVQHEELQRLGLFGEWEKPYVTMEPGYEAEVLRSFAAIVEKGLVYESMRPVLWSTGCKTALAEAEVEYQDRKDTTVYVLFPVVSSPEWADGSLSGVSLLAWTTTPWTLPSNLAAAVNPEITYVIAEHGRRKFILAKERLLASGFEEKETRVLEEFPGKKLLGMKYSHPFLPRSGEVYEADFVTKDSGTGIVHIAPGHGMDDYFLGVKHGLALLSPVDGEGRFTEECGLPGFAGKYVFDANAGILEVLKAKGAFWRSEEYSHSYPHCWRSKTPLIFRCAKQWFIRIDGLRQACLDAIETVQWVPASTKARIHGAIKTRPDWCISRQRSWGIPLPAFYDKDGKATLDAGIIRKFADLVEGKGTNLWYSESDAGLCSLLGISPELRKGMETLDVWIDSGTSHAAVVQKRLRYPADLYLEGSDQHRGWFNSSLVTAIAMEKGAPYRQVLTHGFVVDVDGKKLSKSSEYKTPTDMMSFINKYGADIVRLWVASQDYSDNVPFSAEIFDRVSDSYRAFRNTFRILLANLSDFSEKDKVAVDKFSELDLYLYVQLQDLVRDCVQAYKDFRFSQVYHLVNNFCSIKLSAFYIDCVKDTLYCDARDSAERRASQTVLFEVLDSLCRILAPMIPFTSEEAWQSAAGSGDGKFTRESVHLQRLPEARELHWSPEMSARWTRLLELRDEVNALIEKKRQTGEIGKNLEARISVSSEHLKAGDSALLAKICMVSIAEILPSGQESVSVSKAEGEKCPRCWKYVPPADGGLCPRCAEVIAHLDKLPPPDRDSGAAE